MINRKRRFIDIAYHQSPARDSESLKALLPTNFIWMEHMAQNFDWVSFKFALFRENINTLNYRVRVKNFKPTRFNIPIRTHRAIKEEKPDVVLVHGLNNYLRIIHLRIVLKKETILLVQHHGEMPRGIIKRVLLYVSIKCVNGVLFTSFDSAKKLRIPENKVHLLMEGSSNFVKKDRLESRQKLGIPMSDTMFLWVGRLIPIKDPLFFLQAFLKFTENNSGQALYIIYQDSTLLESCKIFCKENKNIHFVGSVNHDELQTWYSAADYFVSASKHEGSGYALCEAMACGCIPIVPSIGAFQFMTKNGECALMYDSGTIKSLERVLNESLKINRNEIQTKIEDQFKTKLSFEAIANDLKRIVDVLRQANK